MDKHSYKYWFKNVFHASDIQGRTKARIEKNGKVKNYNGTML